MLSAAVFPMAVNAAPGAQSSPLFDGGYLLQVAGSLLLVLVALFGLLFLLKRMNGLPAIERKGIRMLASLKVGTREKVVLLEAGGSQLLVGVAAGSVRTLHVLDATAAGAGATDNRDDAGTDAKDNGNFSDVLHNTTAGQQP